MKLLGRSVMVAYVVFLAAGCGDDDGDMSCPDEVWFQVQNDSSEAMRFAITASQGGCLRGEGGVREETVEIDVPAFSGTDFSYVAGDASSVVWGVVDGSLMGASLDCTWNEAGGFTYARVLVSAGGGLSCNCGTVEYTGSECTVE